MKKTRLHIAMMALIIPFASFSLGMGEMTVGSSLDQPFKAEVLLIDVGGVPLTGIKANLASIDDFERMGLDRDEILTLLRFEVKRNEKGKAVIAISSSERIVEPFLQIVVDLAWANGQLYRGYTVLLDPPGYQLSGPNKASATAVRIKSTGSYENAPGVINKPLYAHVVDQGTEGEKHRKEATYGPTIANENIWQIAQRYTTPDTAVQQVILAIVGTNSQAFTQGNLNGLKSNERLRIPSSDEVKKVPADLARQEVEAHDIAWQNQEAIKHVILPPYVDGVTGSSQFDDKNQQPGAAAQQDPSTIPQAPAFKQQAIVDSHNTASQPNTANPQNQVVQQTNTAESAISSLFTTADNLLTSVETGTKPPPAGNEPVKQDPGIKAEIAVTTAAIDSMRMTNSQLNDQLQALQDNNKLLQQKMIQRDEDINQLREQMSALLKERQAVSAQAAQNPPQESSDFWLYLLLILGGAGVGGYLFWRFYLKDNEKPFWKKREPGQDPISLPVKPVLGPGLTVDAQDSVSSVEIRKNHESLKVQPETTPQVNKPELSEVKTLPSEMQIMPVEPEPEPQQDPEPVVVPDLPEIIESHPSDLELPYPPENKVEVVANEEKKVTYKRPLSDLLAATQEETNSVQTSLDSPIVNTPASQVDEKPEEKKEDDYLLDFEPSLEKIVEQNILNQSTDKPKEVADDTALEFTTSQGADTKKPAITTEDEKESLVTPPDLEEENHNLQFNNSDLPLSTKPENADIEIEDPFDLESSIYVSEKVPDTHEELIESESIEALLNGDEPEQKSELMDELSGMAPENLEQQSNEFIINDIELETENQADEAVWELDIPEESEELREVVPVKDDNTPRKLVKSKAALDTLLALAKTYLGMDDIDAARQSLQEVAAFGDEEQIKEAQALLNELDKK